METGEVKARVDEVSITKKWPLNSLIWIILLKNQLFGKRKQGESWKEAVNSKDCSLFMLVETGGCDRN